MQGVSLRLFCFPSEKSHFSSSGVFGFGCLGTRVRRCLGVEPAHRLLVPAGSFLQECPERRAPSSPDWDWAVVAEAVYLAVWVVGDSRKPHTSTSVLWIELCAQKMCWYLRMWPYLEIGPLQT